MILKTDRVRLDNLDPTPWARWFKIGATKSDTIQIPEITLPKERGTSKGIDEKKVLFEAVKYYINNTINT